MNKLVFLLMLVFSISSAQAAGYTVPGQIKRVFFYEGHNGVLIIHDEMGVREGCARGDNYILRSGHPFFKEIYSLLLAAHMSGQPVTLHFNGCHETFPSIVNVDSYK